ncbi:MAG TPA: cysteine synthase family protein [Gemmatimonadaceae bacterium]
MAGRAVFNNVLEMLPGIDNPTPMVRVNRLSPSSGYALYAKLEWQNPFGSVKDRVAGFMIRDLLERGQLSAGRGIVEPTSGNTGLSLALACAALGYRVRAVVPNKVPLEKKILLKLCGAELDVVSDALCPAPGASEGSINLAKTHAKAQPDRYVMPNQYENEQNVLAHYRTTGPEIWQQTDGRITHLFVSLGTCGTVTGTARFLKEQNPAVKVVAVLPPEDHDVPGLRSASQLEATKLYDPSVIDEQMEIHHDLAYERARDLATMEGLPAGPSAGLILEGARRVIERHPTGVGVMIFPDNSFKYVSNFAKHLPELVEGTSV